MKRVFISYSRTNLDVVTQLVQDLEEVGLETWHDQTLPGGQRWWDNILGNIRACDVFIFALSPASWESEACRSELAYVQQLSKVILPVLVADGINLNLLPSPINEFQVTDYRKGDKKAAFALVKSIHTVPPSPPLPDPLPQPPKAPISYLSNLKERIDSAAPLNAQEQGALMFELESGLRDGRSPAEMRDLLVSFKRRNDLLAKVATRIDEALVAVDEVPAPRPTPGQNVSPNSPSGVAARQPAGSPPGPLPVSPPSSSGPRPSGNSKSRHYACPQSAATQLIADLKRWLDGEGFALQQMNTDGEGVLLQIKKRGNWRDFVGMSTSLNVVFYQAKDTLTVEIGAAKWIDKAAVGAVGCFVLWPLAIPAAYGAWEQMKMPERIFKYIGERFVHASGLALP